MEKPEIFHEPAREISRAALKIAIGGGFSLIAGLASQVLTAYLFGAGAEMDAFFTSLTIPLYLQIVLLGGLPFVVIPAFIREESSGHENEAWSLTGTMIYVTLAVLMVSACLGAIFSRQIIDLSAPGFGEQKAKLASQMLTLLMFTVPFSGLGTFTSGVENVRGRFFWPAAATAIGSVGNVVTLFLLHPLIGPMSLAWGNLFSTILFACVTTIPVIRHGWKNLMPVSDPRINELLKLIAPFILFGLITNSRLIFERYFASPLPDGQLSYIGYAFKIANIFVMLLASSIASAYFPAMARAFSLKGIQGLVKQAEDGLRITLALGFPVVIITSVLSIPLVKLFFERGAFLSSTTLAVSSLIPIVMINEVLFRMITNMIGRTFFVIKDTLTTNLISSVTIVIYIIFAYFLTKIWGYWGLALAQPIQVSISILLMCILLYRKIQTFPFLALMKCSAKYIAFGILAGLIAWFSITSTSHISTIFQLAIGIISSSTVYLGLLYWFEKNTALTIFEMTGIIRIYSIIKNRFHPIEQIPLQ
jgi:putative peptidoglycan lipid II flippase